MQTVCYVHIRLSMFNRNSFSNFIFVGLRMQMQNADEKKNKNDFFKINTANLLLFDFLTLERFCLTTIYYFLHIICSVNMEIKICLCFCITHGCHNRFSTQKKEEISLARML